MRSPALFSLILLCGWAARADARLFWQTYGSTVPTADGGCTWNANSDYFVPRHCDTCRYGLYSPCKSSCTTSPACRRCHPHHTGYCSPYGCLHYCWRNHVYAHKCGCSPVSYHGPYREGCGPCLCERGSCSDGMCPAGGMCGIHDDQACSDCMYLPNVESGGLQILGAISLSGDPLLTSLQLGVPAAGMPLLPGQALPAAIPTTIPQAMPEPLPMLGQPPAQTMPHPPTPPQVQ
jgi:hypothetical protein